MYESDNPHHAGAHQIESNVNEGTEDTNEASNNESSSGEYEYYAKEAQGDYNVLSDYDKRRFGQWP